jgi:hypothetical protein
MAHAKKPDFVFHRNGWVHLNRRGRQFSRLLAAEVCVRVCASAVVMLDTPCSEVVWRVLATHYIRQFPLYFPSRASPCAITFHLDSTVLTPWNGVLRYKLTVPQHIQKLRTFLWDPTFFYRVRKISTLVCFWARLIQFILSYLTLLRLRFVLSVSA